MKKLTSILITLLFAFSVEGQEVNDPGFTAKRDTAELRRLFGIGFATADQVEFPTPNKKIDSVLVLMLVTDTARYTQVYESLKTRDSAGYIIIDSDSITYDTVYRDPDLSVYAIIGYEVRSIGQKFKNYNDGNWHTLIAEFEDYYTHLEYLDDKKQPLSKNIIVWQSINQK